MRNEPTGWLASFVLAKLARRLAVSISEPSARCASAFPIGRVRAHYFSARQADLLGRPRKLVERHVAKGLRWANKVQLPYDEALLELYMARSTDAPASRSRILAQCRVLFAKCEAHGGRHRKFMTRRPNLQFEHLGTRALLQKGAAAP
jgi:hypothetical protein